MTGLVLTVFQFDRFAQEGFCRIQFAEVEVDGAQIGERDGVVALLRKARRAPALQHVGVIVGGLTRVARRVQRNGIEKCSARVSSASTPCTCTARL